MLWLVIWFCNFLKTIFMDSLTMLLHKIAVPRVTTSGGLCRYTIEKCQLLDFSVLTELLCKWFHRAVYTPHFAVTFEILLVAAGTEAAVCVQECCPGLHRRVKESAPDSVCSFHCDPGLLVNRRSMPIVVVFPFIDTEVISVL